MPEYCHIHTSYQIFNGCSEKQRERRKAKGRNTQFQRAGKPSDYHFCQFWLLGEIHFELLFLVSVFK